MPAKPLILMVEDNDHDVTLLRAALSDAAIEVDIAVVGTCFEAVTFLERAGKHRSASRPDLILIDLNLPMDNGRQLTAFLKRSDQHRSIPAAVYSSTHQRAETAGPDEDVFLMKPTSYDGFATVVAWLRDTLALAPAET